VRTVREPEVESVGGAARKAATEAATKETATEAATGAVAKAETESETEAKAAVAVQGVGSASPLSSVLVGVTFQELMEAKAAKMVTR
jgi:hypothetical protein